jgi:hypothetical protein
MSIRDSNVIILEIGRTTVRAGLGLHDLLKTPTIVCVFFSDYVSQARAPQCSSAVALFRKYLLALDCDEMFFKILLRMV